MVDNNNSNVNAKDDTKLIGIRLSTVQLEMLNHIKQKYRATSRAHTLRLLIEDTYKKRVRYDGESAR